MNRAEIKSMLLKMGLPVAYRNFDEPQKGDFILFYKESDSSTFADDKNFYRFSNIVVELYTNKKKEKVEEKLESIFDECGLCYEADETKIESEKLYCKSYFMQT